jgi:circadian clock protein KaiB
MNAPTLVRQLPPPVRKLIGDISDAERVLIGLDLCPKG